ncbi:NAD(P)H-binding protein [Levilactobacillus namurensis]|uniref:NAD(P)H-binding protein n=1 Tax=Levilactobacillus namurensis TaxID=380393 RepID=UPI001D6B58A8|nr:NAD(P)H-binding protein [Levilactobacillus namurensis]HJE45779.1 NAD(P)H-binding protein [Levilactobacillus namurensis]
MQKVLLLGAASQISKYLIPDLLEQTDVALTLFARHATTRLATYQANPRVTLVDGDWNDESQLQTAIRGHDLVYLATGHFKTANENVVSAMHATGVTRLVVAGGLGIYDEVVGKFGQWNASMMGDYTQFKEAAAVIDQSQLDYTFMRMSWLYDDQTHLDYELIPKGMPFKDAQVTRQAVAQLVTDIVKNPELAKGENVGVGEPNTEFDRPSFY